MTANTTKAEKDEIEQRLQRALGDCVLDRSWLCSVIGALVSIPVGIRRKSFQPLVFFGTTGAMADIILGITNCESERHEFLKFIEEKQSKVKKEGSESLETLETFEGRDREGVLLLDVSESKERRS